MALADITAKIEADAKAEAGRILEKADEQKGELLAQSQKDIADMEDAFKEKFAKEQPEIFRRREIVANMDVRREQLNAKREMIREAFAMALEKMSAMDKDKYLQLMTKLLQIATDTKDEKLIVSSNEQYITEEWLAAYNASNGTRFSFSQKDPKIKGGFVLNQGKIRINCTMETLNLLFQEDREAEVVKQLFAAPV